jgi:hypothetical protein
MHTCLDQYRANKATGGNGGLIWIRKGGGYYSECNKRQELSDPLLPASMMDGGVGTVIMTAIITGSARSMEGATTNLKSCGRSQAVRPSGGLDDRPNASAELGPAGGE